MSQWNGDKARFNRERKQNILRRKKTKELMAQLKAVENQAAGTQKPQTIAAPAAVPAPE